MVRPLIERNRDVTRTGLEAQEWYGPLIERNRDVTRTGLEAQEWYGP